MSSFVVTGGIVFNPGASAYNILGHCSLQGEGVINNSGVTQTFTLPLQHLGFAASASAGDDVVYVTQGEPSAELAVVFAQKC